jgi:hypothetical protein
MPERDFSVACAMPERDATKAMNVKQTRELKRSFTLSTFPFLSLHGDTCRASDICRSARRRALVFSAERFRTRGTTSPRVM